MRIWGAVAAALSFGFACGCGDDGPELGSVEGTVKLGGQPLEAATVYFTPTAGGRPSIGKTDDAGRYELAFTADRHGALLGEHTVEISTFQKGDSDSGRSPAPERVPAKYNRKTDLKKTVEAGDNVIDFELDAKEKVVQPRE